MRLEATIEYWPFAKPLRTAVHTIDGCSVLVVTLERDGHRGRGEAAGVFYRPNEDPKSLCAQVESMRAQIEAGLDRRALQSLLPAGGARNALDCALWDLEAKCSGTPTWRTAGLDAPHSLLTTVTCGADKPEAMAATARSYSWARALKLKLTGEPIDADRIRAVREARKDAWLSVDANQSFMRPDLERLIPTLMESQVQLIEQPFTVGREFLLEGLRCPIPIAADETAQGLADLPSLVGRFDMVNIKLDKCGGLTEGLAMARAARDLGLGTMVGNMVGTSLGMAPAFLVGQLCKVVDLDCPLFLKADRETAVRYDGGCLTCPPELWGHSEGD